MAGEHRFVAGSRSPALVRAEPAQRTAPSTAAHASAEPALVFAAAGPAPGALSAKAAVPLTALAIPARAAASIPARTCTTREQYLSAAKPGTSFWTVAQSASRPAGGSAAARTAK